MDILGMEFDHAGIATADIEDAGALFADLLEVEVVHEESLDGLEVAFLDVGGSYLELLEPSGGPIADYLDRNGPGIHHLAFATDDAAAAIERAQSLGIEAIDEEPRDGAWGHDVAFLHPSDTAGVLVEFVEH